MTNKYESVQGGIWLKRQAQYKSDLANFDGQIRSAEAQMPQAKSDAAKYSTRLKLAKEAQNVYEPLLDKGYVSKLQVLTSTDNTTEMSRLMAERRTTGIAVSRDSRRTQGGAGVLYPEMVFRHGYPIGA